LRQKLSLITFGVSDLKRALDFYEKGLGWRRSSASLDDLILFPLGGMVLALYPRKLLAEDALVAPEGSGFAGVTLSYNAKSEKEVDEVMDEVKRFGATIAKPAQKVFWGGYSGYFKDPDGHLIEVAYNPFWQLDEDGNVVLPTA
jgi:catechol 2,3-dioxygenase-like lactoylglutathione lyase family enzyme